MDDRILLGLVVGGVGGGALLLYNYGKEQFDYFLEKRKENQINKEKEKIDNQPINRNLKSIETLEELKESGLLTENEYDEKVQKLKGKIQLEQIKDTAEYQKLKDLFDKGILSIDEFESKVKLLNKNDGTIEEFVNLSNEDNFFENRIPNQNEVKFNLFKSLIPVFIIVFVILGVVFYKKINKSEDANDFYNETSTESTNYNDNEELTNYQDHVKNKKFVYVYFKVQIPKFKYVQIGEIDISNKYSTVEKFYSTDWEDKVFTTDIIEIDDYNEDEKYRILDNAESEIYLKMDITDRNYYSEVNYNCKDTYEKDKLLKEKSKIIETNVYEFNSYSEASSHKRNF